MFPDIPEAAIRADLARTGSPAITSDNILRNGGFLPLPAATSAEQRAVASGGNNGGVAANNNSNNNSGDNARAQTTARGEAVGSSSTGVVLNALQSPLVNRLRVSKDADSEQLPPPPPKVWESDSDKRSDILRQRKEFMLMEARKKYMEKLKQKSGSESSSPAPL
ncbi:hypothetical protein LPJ56_003836 [Coemansia sp. RSA 2599]|nr:hypothetical protein LPJ75_003603 [Coemansia sp. RSA 2598]KAJ1818456.1 hypothetical protein LPJ56_003836 [Coemansia sp. RSA 2599]